MNGCVSEDGYYGDTCEKKIDLTMIQDIKILILLYTIATTNAKLKTIESKLDRLINICHDSYQISVKC